jgi:hypothetical protein
MSRVPPDGRTAPEELSEGCPVSELVPVDHHPAEWPHDLSEQALALVNPELYPLRPGQIERLWGEHRSQHRRTTKPAYAFLAPEHDELSCVARIKCRRIERHASTCNAVGDRLSEPLDRHLDARITDDKSRRRHLGSPQSAFANVRRVNVAFADCEGVVDEGGWLLVNVPRRRWLE